MNPFTQSFQSVLRGALRLNSRARFAAERLAGRSIALDMPDTRWLIVFADADVEVLEDDDTAADATVRGSMPAVFAELGGFGSEAARLGDLELIDDFITSFRPNFDPKDALTDLQDATRVGVAAVQSAFEGLRGASPSAPTDDRDDEIRDLKATIERLNKRIEQLEQQ